MRAVYSSDGDGGARGAWDTDPKPGGVSTAEVYGFVGWIASSVAYVLYMLWSYTPNWVLEAHGVSYYPSKYWAVALPVWLCITIVAIFWLYESLCMMTAAPPGSAASLHDGATRRKEDACMASYFSPAEGAIPPLVDMPLELASLALHGGLTLRDAEQLYDRRQRERAAGGRQLQQAPGL